MGMFMCFPFSPQDLNITNIIDNMAQRRSGNSHTTISITWDDKDEFRRYASKVKSTKNGEMYESDAVLFHKMLELYKDKIIKEPMDKAQPTYPNKISLSDVQQDFSL